MNGSSYMAEDPWANGWASEPVPSPSAPLELPLAPSDLAPSDLAPLMDNYPESYHRLYAAALSMLATGVRPFLNRLDADLLSESQRALISDALAVAGWSDLSVKEHCYHMFALLALELELPGDGSLHVLSFRRKSLPELPAFVVNAVLSSTNNAARDFAEPLSDPSAVSAAFASEWEPPAEPSHALPLLMPSEGPMDPHSMAAYLVELRSAFAPLVASNDSIRVREVPEKEGLLFKHINYIITHDLKIGPTGPAGTKKVIRRYLDFSWLLDFLLKKYPFRIIPGLPPKKFSVGASPDSQFLQRRRRGLHRFLAQLVRHPVLRTEPVVATFMTVPTDMASWRRQARVDYAVEFAGQRISARFLQQVWPAIGPQFESMWLAAQAAVPGMIEAWSRIVVLVERHEKRQQQISSDHARFGTLIGHVKALAQALYPHEQAPANPVCATNLDDMHAMDEGLGAVGDAFAAARQIVVDESIAINTGTLEKFKHYLDYLYSAQELFDRADKLSGNTIAQTEARVQGLEKQYRAVSTDGADATGADLVKLRQAIVGGKQEIFRQLNRDYFIKQCCLQEYAVLQETQLLVGAAWLDWCRVRMHSQRQLAGVGEALMHDIENDLLPR